jgi:hypothetical protein
MQHKETTTMKKILFPLFCVMIIMTSTLLSVNALTLNLTVTTNKQTYNRYEQVQISGMLTQDGSPFPSGLVAIQVVDPQNNFQVIRTVNTGQNPQENPLAEVLSCFLSDAGGNPVSVATKGSLAYFTVTVSNYDTAPRTVLTTINVYDSNNVVLDQSALSMQFAGRETQSFTISIDIPSGAASGTAVAFANVYTAWPKVGGVALSPEKPFTFNIVNSGGSPPSTPNGNQGAYNLLYKLPKRANIGSYTVYATSTHDGVTASGTTSFTVVQPGDTDHDGDVDSSDTSKYVKAYIGYWSQQPWDQGADLDKDGDVDSIDTAAYVRAYILYWSG